MTRYLRHTGLRRVLALALCLLLAVSSIGVTAFAEEAAGPVITAQPVDYGGQLGDTATFTVEASGEGLTYQWQFHNGTKWSNSSSTGNKTATLSIGMTEARLNYQFRCVVKGGGVSVTTDAVKMVVLSGNDVLGRVIIASAGDWAAFVRRVNDGETGLNAIMAADIVLPSDTALLGTVAHPYGGTFEGNGHTITVNLTADRARYGLFRDIGGAIIRNLHVDGAVTGGYRMTGGMVGCMRSTSTLENCRVSTVITSTVEDDCAVGGVVGCAVSGTVIMRNCLFDGSMLGENSTYAAGLLGFSYNAYPEFSNCFFDPAEVTAGMVWKTLYRTEYGSSNINNCWYGYYINNIGMYSQGSNATGRTAADVAQRLGVQWTVEEDHARVILSAQEIPMQPLETDAIDRVLIGSAYDWGLFAWRVNHGETSLSAVMTADVTLNADSEMVGLSGKEYRGDFSGNGHTLTVDFSGSDNYVAPFRQVNGASIHDLTVAGSVRSSNYYASGLIGRAYSNTVSVSRVRVSAAVSSSSYYMGGLLGYVDTTVNMTDCLFDGTISVTGSNYPSGFAGSMDSYDYLNVTNCLFDPAELVLPANFNASSAATFARPNSSSPAYMVLKNAWYTQAFGTAQGSDGSAMTASELAAALGANWTVEGETKAVPVSTVQQLITEPLETDLLGRVILEDAEDWFLFTWRVNHGETGLGAVMENDITLASDAPMVGSNSYYYRGSFSGNGHTLTVNYTAAGQYAAPFSRTSGVTINDLHVAGTIVTGYQYAGGILGYVNSDTYLNRCRSSVTIASSVAGDGGLGGLVGYGNDDLYITDCLFDGSLLGESAASCGGFVAWESSYNLRLTNCLFDPAQITASPEGSATFYRASGNKTLNNSWYTQAFGTAQGSDGSAMTASELAAVLGANWTVAGETHAVPVMSSEQVLHSANLDEAGNVLIASPDDWYAFCYMVNNGLTGTGAVMTADVTLTAESPMAGTESNRYTGTFDGCGHTLTLAYESAAQHTAPFSQVNGAKILRLHTAGTVSSSAQFATGLIGYSTGATNVLNCRVSAAVTSTAEGDGTNAGFVGRNYGNLVMADCLFDGSLLGETATHNGGFVGYRNSGSVTMRSCLFAPAQLTMGAEGSDTFMRSFSGEMTNCFYTQTFGAARGSAADEMSAAELAEALGACWSVSGSAAALNTGVIGLTTAVISDLDAFYTYTGEPQEPVPTVTVAGRALEPETDFTVSYEDNMGPNTTATLTVTGTGRYVGTKTATFLVPALEGECGSGLTWQYDDAAEVLTIAYTAAEGTTGAMDDYAENGAPWNYYRDRCVRIVLPEGLTYIGSYAFRHFKVLNGEVTMPSTLTGLGRDAFSDSSITAVTLPAGVTSIGINAFCDCASLSAADISACTQLTELPQGVFARTQIAAITIPASVTSLGNYVFQNDAQLKDVYLEHTEAAPALATQVFNGVTANLWVKTPAVFEAVGTGWGTGSFTLRSETIRDLSDSRWAVITGVPGAAFATGEAIAPVPTVTMFGTALTAGTDYDVAYGANIAGEGTVTVTGKGAYTGSQTLTFRIFDGAATYLDENGEEAAVASADIAVYNGETTFTEGWWLLAGNTTVNSRIAVSGDVHLILADNVTLTAPKGIQLTGENCLTVYAQSALNVDEQGSVAGEQTCGAIVINGVDSNNAGIGGNSNQRGGTLTVNGGVIDTTGNEGAGIGGGRYASGGTVTINGGYVRAIGGSNCAGIGSADDAGSSSTAGIITINGGVVYAEGKSFSAGIGAGDDAGSCGAITINGGFVTAQGSYSGIGVGYYTNGAGTIAINGGVVRATGNSVGGIGGVNVTTALSWTDSGDSIYASSYKGTVTIAEGKSFRYTDSGEAVTVPIAGGKTIVPDVELAITAQPEDFAGVSGGEAVFSVTAEGAGLTYQWQFLTEEMEEWADLEEETSAQLRIALTSPEQGGVQYRCVVTDACGNSLTSDAATLTVGSSLTITAQPVDYAGKIGDTATFTVAAEGEGLTYQWEFHNGATWKSSTSAGSRTATLSIGMTAARMGYSFRCVITDRFGNSVTSEAVRMVEAAAALAITRQPVDYAGSIGDTATFSVAAEGEGLQYQWQFNKGTGWQNSTSTGNKTANFSIGMTAARMGYSFRCVITDAQGNTVTSDTVRMVEAAAALAITRQPVNYAGSIGDTAAFSVAAEGEGLSYQWQFHNGTKWANSTSTGNKTANFSIGMTTARMNYQFRCVITDAQGNTVTSDTVRMVEAAAALVITRQPVNYVGSIGDTATFSVAAEGEGLTYQWQFNKGAGWQNSGSTGNRTANFSIGMTEARLVYQIRCVITDSVGNSVISDVVCMTEAAAPAAALAITAQPADYVGSIGDTATFSVAAEGEGLTYQWQFDKGAGWQNSGSTGAATATLSIGMTAARMGYSFRCIVTDAGGSTVTTDTVRMVEAQ